MKRSSKQTDDDSEVRAALDAMSADDLRAFVRDVLNSIDHEPRARIEDALFERAVRAGAGWRPKGPSSKNADEVNAFVAAARRVGQAAPSDVDRYLRQGLKASLAGDHAGARSILGALLRPIADGEIDLGQDE